MLQKFLCVTILALSIPSLMCMESSSNSKIEDRSHTILTPSQVQKRMQPPAAEPREQRKTAFFAGRKDAALSRTGMRTPQNSELAKTSLSYVAGRQVGNKLHSKKQAKYLVQVINNDPKEYQAWNNTYYDIDNHDSINVQDNAFYDDKDKQEESYPNIDNHDSIDVQDNAFYDDKDKQEESYPSINYYTADPIELQNKHQYVDALKAVYAQRAPQQRVRKQRKAQPATKPYNKKAVSDLTETFENATSPIYVEFDAKKDTAQLRNKRATIITYGKQKTT